MARSLSYGIYLWFDFLLITLTKVRKMIIESIPTTLKSAITAGIGTFLAYVGIKNAGF